MGTWPRTGQTPFPSPYHCAFSTAPPPGVCSGSKVSTDQCLSTDPILGRQGRMSWAFPQTFAGSQTGMFMWLQLGYHFSEQVLRDPCLLQVGPPMGLLVVSIPHAPCPAVAVAPSYVIYPIVVCETRFCSCFFCCGLANSRRRHPIFLFLGLGLLTACSGSEGAVLWSEANFPKIPFRRLLFLLGLSSVRY